MAASQEQLSLPPPPPKGTKDQPLLRSLNPIATRFVTELRRETTGSVASPCTAIVRATVTLTWTVQRECSGALDRLLVSPTVKQIVDVFLKLTNIF